jgi:hypothetical protein
LNNKHILIGYLVGNFITYSSKIGVVNKAFNLLTHTVEKTPGVHTPYMYCGTPGTVFAWHVEDWHLSTANFLLCGQLKHWYVVPGKYIRNLVEAYHGMWNIHFLYLIETLTNLK